MDRIYVDSTNLDWVEYERETNLLRIGFKSGGSYEYYDVPETVYDGLLNASSKGSYFHHNIKMAGYAYSKID